MNRRSLFGIGLASILPITLPDKSTYSKDKINYLEMPDGIRIPIKDGWSVEYVESSKSYHITDPFPIYVYYHKGKRIILINKITSLYVYRNMYDIDNNIGGILFIDRSRGLIKAKKLESLTGDKL